MLSIRANASTRAPPAAKPRLAVFLPSVLLLLYFLNDFSKQSNRNLSFSSNIAANFFLILQILISKCGKQKNFLDIDDLQMVHNNRKGS